MTSSPGHASSDPRRPLAAAICVFAGVAITLVVRGYRFGESNHAVYLVDAVRRLDPSLLRNDWWAQSTLQYHFVFNALTAGLMRLGILGPAFLVGYLLLAVLLHVAWQRLTLALGGSDGTYLLSVVLFYVLAGGVGLGMYHFLQDSAFLPSNISNVAMLWGIYFWIVGTPALAGACLGVAGMFHINHALAGIVLWFGAGLIEGRGAWRTKAWWIGTLSLLALSGVQIVPAARVVLSRSGKLPLDEFIDLFVRLRHPHHFDPRAWHWGVWLTFLLPLPFAWVAARARPRDDPGRRAAVVFGIYVAMITAALLTAGFWFVGETFVQLNLYRFSIYPKLLSCVALAWLLWGRSAGRKGIICGVGGVGILASAGVLLLFFFRGRAGFDEWFHNIHVAWVFLMLATLAVTHDLPWPSHERRRTVGGIAIVIAMSAAVARDVPAGIRLSGLAGDGAEYLALATWARDHTPADAVFLVPPDEESFRVHARRAIVVNFKGVPQLSAELPEWRDRLRDVLDLDTAGLLALPRPLGKTMRAIRARYGSLPPEHLFEVARKYGARYVILTRRADETGARLVHSDSNHLYYLYDLGPETVNPRPRPGRADTARLSPPRE